MALLFAKNNSLSAVTELPASVSGGGLNLISTQTASDSASISFTSGLDSTYKQYIFKFYDIHPEEDNRNLGFTMSTDGGSNYNVAKTTTFFYSYHDETDSYSGLTYHTGKDLAQGTGNQMILVETGNDNDQSACGFLRLFDPSSTTFMKMFYAESNSYEATNNNQHSFVAGYGNTTDAVNAVQFSMQSGAIQSGIIKLYGVT